MEGGIGNNGPREKKREGRGKREEGVRRDK